MKTSRKASPKIVMTTSPKKIKIQGQVTDEQVITVTTATKKLLTNIASKTHPTYRRSTSLGDEINHKLGHH